jgi:putative sugar O-methyltransferase
VLNDGGIAAEIEAMRSHVAAAPEIYRPGAFWAELIDANLEMLATDGVENFKRTVANNYYNWVVWDPRDPQIKRSIVRWMRQPNLSSLRTSMESQPGVRTLDRDDRYELTGPAAFSYRFFVGQAWARAQEEDRLGLCQRLQEPEVGNPIRIRDSEGRLISQDLANSIIECNFAAASGRVRDGARIAELGAGYGRLAYVHAQASEAVYCIFDIPPALAVAQRYLTDVLGSERVVRFSPHPDLSVLRQGCVAFFTPDQLEVFPDGWFDLTQTISTLPEMPREQADHFLALLGEKSSGALFLKQWKRWRNPADLVELAEDFYRLPEGWRLTHRRTDPIQPLFFNQLWQRAA